MLILTLSTFAFANSRYLVNKDTEDKIEVKKVQLLESKIKMRKNLYSLNSLYSMLVSIYSNACGALNTFFLA